MIKSKKINIWFFMFLSEKIIIINDIINGIDNIRIFGEKFVSNWFDSSFSFDYFINLILINLIEYA